MIKRVELTKIEIMEETLTPGSLGLLCGGSCAGTICGFGCSGF